MGSRCMIIHYVGNVEQVIVVGVPHKEGLENDGAVMMNWRRAASNDKQAENGEQNAIGERHSR